MSQNPFELLSSREVYRNRWIRVREDEVIRPGGARGIFGVVEMRHGATVLAVDRAGDAYLVNEYKYAIGREMLELISGAIEDGDTPLEAARRELLEEAGLRSDRWIDLGVVNPFTSAVCSPNHLFMALDCDQGEASPDEGEILELVRVPLREAIEMAMDGRISHAGSAVALLKASHKL